jgi:PAS domain S-box-containing protein
MAILGVVVETLLIGLTILGFNFAAGNAIRADQVRGEELDAAGLLDGMRAQELALRDYLDSGDPRALEAYLPARERANLALGQLRREAAGTVAAGPAARMEAAARDWQGWAEGARQGPAPVDPDAAAAAQGEGRQLFEAFAIAQRALVSELEAESQAARARAYVMGDLELASLVGAAVLLAGVVAVLAQRIVRLDLVPLHELAEAAAEVAAGRQAHIPHGDRADEIGELSQALQLWQDISSEREILVEQAPLGISWVDRSAQIRNVNAAYLAMHGYRREEMVGRLFFDFIHPEDRDKDQGRLIGLLTGAVDHVATENRHVRSDGTVLWCSVITGSVRGPGGEPRGFITILQDITRRKRQLERAAQVQRQLLPQAAPELDGYQLAGDCVPAEDVAGDFYDWVLPEPGYLDLTVADVMGKGIGSALLMAALRTALRTASPQLGPAARIGLAAESMALGVGEEGLFITLFHARLHLATGVLTYVDAGHGHCVVRRPTGELVRLTERTMPVGVMPNDQFKEGEVRLAAGDALVVHSDGLLETGEQMLTLADFAEELSDSEDAAEMVRRLMARTSDHPSDDVTAVVLRRL